MTKKTKKSISSLKGEIIIYRAPDGKTALDVRLEGETLWLNQKQISELFQTERSVITKHFGNIFRSGELDKHSACAKFAHTAEDGKTYQTNFYNLDAIISVGYRVNSKRGTEFRMWATRVLREYFLKGYTVNEQRLKELRQTIHLVQNVIEHQSVSNDEAGALLKVVTDYSYALDLLDDYDHQRVEVGETTQVPTTTVTYEEAVRIVEHLRKNYEASDLFGKEKDNSLESSLQAVVQTFDGKDVYPSLEEKAACLLYFLVKNHSFIDGNKRIAAALFLWFMDKNNALYREDNEKRLANNALVAITLMIAESRPDEKDLIIKMVVNLINK